MQSVVAGSRVAGPLIRSGANYLVIFEKQVVIMSLLPLLPLALRPPPFRSSRTILDAFGRTMAVYWSQSPEAQTENSFTQIKSINTGFTS